MTRTQQYLVFAAAILVTAVVSGIAGGFTTLVVKAVLESLAGGDTLIAVTVAMFLKPVLTALFIRAGAVGGMLTPALSTGVATGAVVALAVNHLGGEVSVPTLALIGGAAVLGITQHAPLFAAVFTAELTHPPLKVWAMLLFATVGAHVLHAAVTRRRAAAKAPAER